MNVLPVSLRVALAIAASTALVSGTLLVRSDFGQGVSDIAGQADGDLPQLGSGDLGLTTPSPTPVIRAGGRSRAVITVPGTDEEPKKRRDGLPTFGRYVFGVAGSEEGGALTRRDHPPEMTMTVHREEPPDGPPRELADNELVFDLSYSSEHQETEIVAYTREGMVFTFESLDITLGASHGGDAFFDPPLLQIPSDLDASKDTSGTTNVNDDSGSVQRVEDWSVEVEGREQIEVLGETTDTWVVSVVRKSQPDSEEQFERTRKYWFDPERGLWVKFEETTSIRKGSGLNATTYSSMLTATLDRIEAL